MVDIGQLSIIVALLAALSVAAERLVDIVKNVIPPLAKEYTNKTREGFRKALLQILSIVASFITVWLTWSAIAGSVPGAPPGRWWTSAAGIAAIIATSVLVSGGSGFWYKIVGYVGEVRDLKQGQLVQALTEARQLAATNPAASENLRKQIEEQLKTVTPSLPPAQQPAQQPAPVQQPVPNPQGLGDPED